MCGFAENYAMQTAHGAASAVMHYFTPEQVPVISTLAKSLRGQRSLACVRALPNLAQPLLRAYGHLIGLCRQQGVSDSIPRAQHIQPPGGGE